MADMDDLFDLMERNMQHLFQERVQQRLACGCWRPSLDIYELADRIVVLVELPGVEKEHVRVTFDQGILNIEGERPDPAPGGTVQRHQIEIDYGRFRRRIRLGIPVKSSEIEAGLNDGYLRVEIPKG